MDSREELIAGAAAGVDVDAVKRVFEIIARADATAGIEELLSFSHDDVEMRAYAAREVSGLGAGELLHGKDEVRDFFAKTRDEGFGITLRTRGFDVDGDTVVVRGSIRVARPDASFAEANVRWLFRFRDGLVDSIGWEPRAGD